jgi:hypothetical protein
MADEPDDDEIDLGDDEEGEFMDMGTLLQALLVAEDGETNVATAITNLTQTIDKHMTTQNKILVKILAKMTTPPTA